MELNNTKYKILQAALGLFATQGVDATTTKQITSAAQVSEGSLYRHFSNKEDLVWYLFSLNYKTLAHDLSQAADKGDNFKTKLEAMIEVFCRLYGEDEALFRFLLLVQHDQLKRITAADITPLTVLHDVIMAGMQHGEVRHMNPDLATAMVMGCVLQPATFHIYGRLTAPMSSFRAEIAQSAYRAIAP